MESPARFIDHTLLKADTTELEIEQLCEEAVEHGFASVCVPPNRVGIATKALYGSDTKVGTVIGFPLGFETNNTKAFQTTEAVNTGAEEIDMVIDLGAAREGFLNIVKSDIERIVSAAEGRTVKVIIECCLFPEPLKRALAETVVDAGADYVKTSTGFSKHGATLEDVILLADTVAQRIGIKASGGIRDWKTCQEMLRAGASRIGTSHGIAIIEEWYQQEINI